jgi:hypothetical protein
MSVMNLLIEPSAVSRAGLDSKPSRSAAGRTTPRTSSAILAASISSNCAVKPAPVRQGEPMNIRYFDEERAWSSLHRVRSRRGSSA